MLSILQVHADTDTDTDDIFLMSFEELLRAIVVSASNTEENLSEAPATMIVLTRQDIDNRGYTDLSEMFDDLPSIDVIRPYGDTYFATYMRGYRTTIGSPYLVMVDGITLNSMYFGITTQIATIPLTHVKQIEIVYGPVSSVYGANAFMGVVNIITQKDKAENGSFVENKLTFGNDGSLIADYNYFYKKDDLRLSLSAKLEEANLADRINSNQVYWLRDEHYANRDLWGDFVDNPALVAGEFSSYISNRGLDFRLYTGNLEIAAQYWLLDTGYGSVYPADRIPANSTWPRIQYGAYLRYIKQLNPNTHSKTLLRYRFDGISNDAYDTESYNVTNTLDSPAIIGGIELQPGESARNLFFSYWQSQNRGWELYQDFDVRLNSKWQLSTGVKYSYKDLQKAYDLPTSGALAPELADPNNDALFPEPAAEVFDDRNRIVWQDKAVYLQGKYQLNENNILNAGLRVDNNSSYGTATTLRLGYVKHFGRYTTKLLYGEAFQEPVPRSLYGGWTGSGSDPTLKPEQSTTLETSLSYTTANISHLISLYQVNNDKTAINFSGGARNAGAREVVGLDYHLQYQKKIPVLSNTRFWSYLSLYLSEKEQKFNLDTGESLGSGNIGDLAKQKLNFGMTSNFTDESQLTFIGRYVSSRNTVDTNPIEQIGSYWTLDSNLRFDNLMIKGLSLGLRVTNLFDQNYYHPGVREADAGDPYLLPEEFNNIGFSGPNNREWTGSNGWYNSRLPQPGRRISLSLMFRF
jgi:outer membrane cobalamin receptor